MLLPVFGINLLEKPATCCVGVQVVKDPAVRAARMRALAEKATGAIAGDGIELFVGVDCVDWFSLFSHKCFLSLF